MDFKLPSPSPNSNASSGNFENAFLNHDFMESTRKRSCPSMPEEIGVKCEIQRFDSVYNSQGIRYTLPSGTSRNLETSSSTLGASALVVTKFWDRAREYHHAELEIRSPHMKAAMKAVIPTCKDVNIERNHITLRNEPACIFHFREELAEYGQSLADENQRRHVLFLLQYMYEELEKEITEYMVLVESAVPPRVPLISFENLWMLYRPGDVCYVSQLESEDMCDWFFRFCSMERCRCTKDGCKDNQWTIRGEVIEDNGNYFGQRICEIGVRRFLGDLGISELPVIPLSFHPQRKEVEARAVARGRKSLGLHGKHARYYKGIARMQSRNLHDTPPGEINSFPTQFTHIQGRVMIDSQMFYRVRPLDRPCLMSTKKIWRTSTGEHLTMTADDLMICPYEVPGYALQEKRWGYFKIDRLEYVNYETSAIEQLVLSKDTMHRVCSLVGAHEEESEGGFDDIIEGKGRGMIFLFHGETGVGKTLMAECVADLCHKPLIRIDALTLGIQDWSVKNGLRDAFMLAERWNAIILIDQADVFLEERKVSDLSRNSIVAVFLRLLEYYKGILILTTDRIYSLDPAIKSRIHVSIHFPNLTPDARQQVWQTFLLKIPGISADNALLATATLRGLAAQDLNGRQIKNVVRAAYSLAKSERAVLEYRHIHTALESTSFEAGFAKCQAGFLRDREETAPARKRRRMGDDSVEAYGVDGGGNVGQDGGDDDDDDNDSVDIDENPGIDGIDEEYPMTNYEP